MSVVRRVLTLFAHPDDETFGPGATLARLAAEGHEVNLVSATRGEAGTIDRSASFGRRRLAEIRTGELVKACQELGIRPPLILSLPDSGLIRLQDETLLRPFVRAIREFRPEIIITFHADGLSGHPDHRTVTERTRRAFDLADDPEYAPELGDPHPVARLWAYSIPESKAALVTWRKLHAVPDQELDAILDVAGFIEPRRAAVAAHATQAAFITNMEERLGGLENFWSEEGFVLDRARVPLPDGSAPVSDLFFGME